MILILIIFLFTHSNHSNKHMLKPSLVLSAYKKKGQVEKRKISFRNSYVKWIALLLGCLVVFGAQYCFDGPSALQRQIVENVSHGQKEISQFTFNLLYALYSFPNILIPLIGGVAIDKFGARIMLVITAFICIIGQAVFAIGGYVNLFWVMLVGRVIFGIGGQTLTASQNTLLSNWFKASELSLVLGICISFPKLGSALNSFINPKLGERLQGPPTYKNVYVPLLIGAAVMVISWLLALVLAYIDLKSEEQEKKMHQSQLLANTKPSKVMPRIQKNSLSKSIQNNKYGSQVRIQQTDDNIVEAGNQNQMEGGQHISLKDIKQLPLTFWLLIIVSMLSEALFIPFLDNGNQYFSIIYKITPGEAGSYLILPYVFCAIICPIFGIVIDRIGKRGYVIAFSCLMFVITYGTMLFLETQDIDPKTNQKYLIAVPLALLGICCALFCTAIVPSVPMIVESRLFGTAFGLMEMLQNLALATFPLIAGAIRQHFNKEIDGSVDRAYGFIKQTQFYFLISLICLIISVILLVTDKYKGNKFNPKDFRKQYVKTVLQKQNRDQM